MKDKFKDEDVANFIKFLNIVAQSAKFEFNTAEIITYFKLLNNMQKVIIPKMESNILEIKEIRNTEVEDKE